MAAAALLQPLPLPLLIALILAAEEEEQEENAKMRLDRRMLRDTSDPFRLPDQRFLELYRLPPQFVIDVIVPRLERYLAPSGANSAAVPTHLIVLMGINYMARGTLQRQLGQDFISPMAQSTVSKQLCKFTKAFEEEFFAEWIAMPTPREKQLNKALFYEKCGLPNVIGALDGSQVAFVANKYPDDYPEFLFVNRHNEHALNVLVIIGPLYWIHYIDATFPGPCNDAHIWRHSSARALLMQEWLNGVRDQVLFADSALPLEPWCLKEYPNPQTPIEVDLNKKLRKGRVVVECGLGYLKNSCRAANKENKPHYDPQTVSRFIHCMAVMSNMILHTRSPLPPIPNVMLPMPPLPPVRHNITLEGAAVRDWMATHF